MLFNRKHGIYFRNNLSQILFYKVKCVCKCLYAIFPSFVVFVETQNIKPGFQCCLVQQFLLRGTQESPGGGSGEANGVSVKQPRDTECSPFYAIELPLHQFYKGDVCVWVWRKFPGFKKLLKSLIYYLGLAFLFL